jgi:hypothetical protein
MSGTGKTSLPKIVAEALMSVCDIVEVESSWRDKNELLGYYNEFSKLYTPKKFTQALYKGTYYQVQIYSDTDEDFYTDTPYEWDINDRVGIKIAPEKITLIKEEEVDEG